MDYNNINRLKSICSKVNSLYDLISLRVSNEKKASILNEVCSLTDVKYLYNFINNYMYSKAIINNLSLYNSSYSDLMIYLNKIDFDMNKFKYVYGVYNALDIGGYFDNYKNRLKCSIKCVIERLNVLDKLNNIINLSISDEDKALELVRIYSSLPVFKSAYYTVITYIDSYRELDMYKDKLKNFNKVLDVYTLYEENGLLYDARLKIKTMYEIDEYNKIKKVITDYIDSDLLYNDYLDNIGISKKRFTTYLNSVYEKDIDIYNKYLIRRKEDKEKETFLKNKEIYDKLSDLIYAVKNNSFKDGTKLSILEYIKRNPFIGKSNFYTCMVMFLNKNFSTEDVIAMKNYIKDNNLQSDLTYKKVTIDKLLRVKRNIIDRELTKEDYQLILNYLESNNIPCVSKSVSEVTKLYVKGLI